MKQIEDLESKIGELEHDMKQIEDLESKIGELEHDLDELRKAVDILVRDCAGLKARAENLERVLTAQGLELDTLLHSFGVK
jgi:regulator of replication initiation timing